MNRRLMLYFGSTTMTTTLADAEADDLLRCWRACIREDPDATQFATIAGDPVMHVALSGVHAITEEIV